jgi:hypothetical protein
MAMIPGDPSKPSTGNVISWEAEQPERAAHAIERQAEAPRKPKAATKGRAGKDALMPKAREFAASGLCTGWESVLQTMEYHGLDAALLRIWGSATDRNEIDRMCARVRAARSGGPEQRLL